MKLSARPARGNLLNVGLGTAALLDGSYLAMTNKGNTFSDNLAVRKSASYASFSLTSLSNNEDAVGSTNLIEMAGGDPGATPLFYIARRNRINSVGQWVINFPAAGGTLALAGTSDINFKCDIEEFDGQESVEKILALELRKFKYIDDEKRRVRRGIIAQQAELVEPLYVKHTLEPDGTEEFDEEGNKITHGYRERLVLDNNAIILDLLCALQVAMKTIHRHEERLASLEQAMKAFTTSGSGK
ncbi:tail fiber domain-containing protein [Escherichia coli]|nr:tail fiber domain-containing protein [Escherichia coli]